jgi:hypothetical protein
VREEERDTAVAIGLLAHEPYPPLLLEPIISIGPIHLCWVFVVPAVPVHIRFEPARFCLNASFDFGSPLVDGLLLHYNLSGRFARNICQPHLLNLTRKLTNGFATRPRPATQKRPYGDHQTQ